MIYFFSSISLTLDFGPIISKRSEAQGTLSQI